jgi:prolyl-tRNA synthetase
MACARCKVERIVREEMNRAGALELVMPVIQPAELWQETGRWERWANMLRLKDRHERDFVVGPTHGEDHRYRTQGDQSYGSCRSIPKIQTKFRDGTGRVSA